MNVSNDDDAELLVRSGVKRENVVVIPYGLRDERHSAFAAMPAGRPHRPVVVCVGRFTWAKGAADMPSIVQKVAKAVPGAEFRLLGTKGVFRTRQDVVRFFPRSVRALVDVIPEFAPSELPGLLADCALGFFPSYYESFGFGVLEMLAASLPVVAYATPGPRMMLESDFLIPLGDTEAMASVIVDLLDDPARLERARIAARERAQGFRWPEIAARTEAVYVERIAQIVAKGPGVRNTGGARFS